MCPKSFLWCFRELMASKSAKGDRGKVQARTSLSYHLERTRKKNSMASTHREGLVTLLLASTLAQVCLTARIPPAVTDLVEKRETLDYKESTRYK
jgi:hypothetical protein